MKSVYWRPQKVSQRGVLLMGLVAIGGLTAVECLPLCLTGPYVAEKTRAVQLAEQGRQAIRQKRAQLGLPANRVFDPKETGLVGSAMSCVTSKPADLAAKQIALHPQFPAAVVHMLLEAGVRPGDTVAIGWSGSFPGLNLAVCAAVESLHLRPIVVASVMSSQYGANEPEFLWLDMESALADAKLISFRTQAASVGGPADRGLGMSPASLDAVQAALHRNGIQPLEGERLAGLVDARMRLFHQRQGDRRIAAYINVGGGIASTGGDQGKALFRAGVNCCATSKAKTPCVDCVMCRFLDEGTPVIHLAQTQLLARRFGFSEAGDSWQVATAGAIPGNGPSRWLAFFVLVAIIAMLRAVILSDLGHQLLHDLLRFTRLTKQPALRVVGRADGPQLMA